MISKSEFYAKLSEYEKLDGMYIPPLLKNQMLGFWDWYCKLSESPASAEAGREAIELIKEIAERAGTDYPGSTIGVIGEACRKFLSNYPTTEQK